MLKNVTIEISAKAFLNDSTDEMRRVTARLFRQWLPLFQQAEQCSVLLWIADGSEILEFSGDLQQTFEWAYWKGCANHCPQSENPTERELRNTHCFPAKYRSDAAPRTYAWLKELIATIKRIGKEMTGCAIRVGATFDNGPEFAISDFKFHRHREIAQGHTLYPNSFVVCNSHLHADSHRYAAYPNGIPEGLPLGTFLGAQYDRFAKSLGYDYIWLSNGMGFGQETWGITGALFDKQHFHPEKFEDAKTSMLEFWKAFYDAAPGVIVETRGSNYSAGTEIATDGAPLKELYEQYAITPPVNSPWAAINYNSGLEIAAWMSHIAELPNGIMPYRFYAHDPWFGNSPWLDRYELSPWDIYQPLTVTRLDKSGHVMSANSVAILAADDSDGNMPEQVPAQVIPHLLTALKNAPDAMPPFLWIYPFSQYNQGRNLHEIFSEEQFIGEALQQGLPLNAVVSIKHFHVSAIPTGTVLVVPVSGATDDVLNYCEQGGTALFYGTLANATQRLCSLLGMQCTDSLTGHFTVQVEIPDTVERGDISRHLIVLPQFDGGGLCETASSEATHILASACQGTQVRVLASSRTLANGGKALFVRSVLPLASEVSQSRDVDMLSSVDSFPAPRLMRWILGECGWIIQCSCSTPLASVPRYTIARHDNGWFWTFFSRDTTVKSRISTPLGAPIFTGRETQIVDDCAVLSTERCLYAQCRGFVSNVSSSIVSGHVLPLDYPDYQGKIVYSGLQNATLRFFPPDNCSSLEAVMSPRELWPSERLSLPLIDYMWDDTPYGRCAVFTNITGYLYLEWGTFNHRNTP